jgi:hypothetical protein
VLPVVAGRGAKGSGRPTGWDVTTCWGVGSGVSPAGMDGAAVTPGSSWGCRNGGSGCGGATAVGSGGL